MYDEKIFSDIQQQFLQKIRNESKYKVQNCIKCVKNEFGLTLEIIDMQNEAKKLE